MTTYNIEPGGPVTITISITVSPATQPVKEEYHPVNKLEPWTVQAIKKKNTKIQTANKKAVATAGRNKLDKETLRREKISKAMKESWIRRNKSSF